MKPGDKVVCIDTEGWIDDDTGLYGAGPKYGEIVTVYSELMLDIPFLELEEYRTYGYDKSKFVPLADWNEAEQFMESLRDRRAGVEPAHADYDYE